MKASKGSRVYAKVPHLGYFSLASSAMRSFPSDNPLRYFYAREEISPMLRKRDGLRSKGQHGGWKHFVRVPDCSMDVLVALVAAAQSKTKAEAAAKLKLSISALDKRFRAASFLLGAPLVQQTDNEIRLTEEGEIFYSSAVRSVEFACLAEQNTRTHLLLKTHHILVGHSSYLAPKVLAMVHGLKFEVNPRVRINHRAGLTASMVQSVREGEMLGGFGLLPLTDPDLVVRKIWEEPLMACIPSSHLTSNRTVIRPEDLDGQPFITVGRGPMPCLHRELEDFFGSMGVKLKIEADAFAPSEALNLVEQRVGICILSKSSAMPHRGVTVRPLWTCALKRESAFFHRDDSQSLLLNELSRIVLDQAKKLKRSGEPQGRRAG